MGEKRVAQQDCGGRAIFPGGSATAAAHLGAIHDVVVHQRREMDELNDGGDAHQLG